MPTFVDWNQTPNQQVVLEHVVRMLCQGQMVVFPTETGPCAAASAIHPASVRRLKSAMNGGGEAGEAPAPQPVCVGVRGQEDARDWVPHLSVVGRRLARRMWPGPLTLQVKEGIEVGLAGQLPTETRQAVSPDGVLRLRSPQHPAIYHALGMCPVPLVLGRTAQGVKDPGLAETDVVIFDERVSEEALPTVVELQGDGYRVVETGIIPPDLLQQQVACVVLFLCTGNTCRSPLAEALCKKRLAEQVGCTVEELPNRGFLVLSAGLAAMPGGRAAPEAITTAETFGADLNAHASRRLTEDLVAQADYLIGMTRSHLQALEDHFHRLGSKPRLLSPVGEDLPDPIGHPLEIYQECARIIWDALGPLLEELRRGRGPETGDRGP
jgi:protein-tyrosine phosphatase